jgi:hypothetical protein
MDGIDPATEDRPDDALVDGFFLALIILVRSGFDNERANGLSPFSLVWRQPETAAGSDVRALSALFRDLIESVGVHMRVREQQAVKEEFHPCAILEHEKQAIVGVVGLAQPSL